MNLRKVLAYARIIDIQLEIYKILEQSLKSMRRWKHRPTKTIGGTFRRAGKVLGLAFHIRNLAIEKQRILQELNRPAFVGGTFHNENPEVISPMKYLKRS